jgi:hypothetical protein
MTGANVETLRRGYDALSGDLSVVLELLDPDIEWHEPAPSPDAGTHRGRDSLNASSAAGSRALTASASSRSRWPLARPVPVWRTTATRSSSRLEREQKVEQLHGRAWLVTDGEDQRLAAARPGLWLR